MWDHFVNISINCNFPTDISADQLTTSEFPENLNMLGLREKNTKIQRETQIKTSIKAISLWSLRYLLNTQIWKILLSNYLLEIVQTYK